MNEVDLYGTTHQLTNFGTTITGRTIKLLSYGNPKISGIGSKSTMVKFDSEVRSPSVPIIAFADHVKFDHEQQLCRNIFSSSERKHSHIFLENEIFH